MSSAGSGTEGSGPSQHSGHSAHSEHSGHSEHGEHGRHLRGAGTRPRVDPGLLPIVLVGLPGAGKTTVARELASRLELQVTDTDAEIRRRTRMTIPQIFAAEGEDGFRRHETRTLRHVLESPARAQGVVALGGGAVVREENRVMLTGHTVVYLRTTAQTAAAHVGDGAGRPLVATGADSDAATAALAQDQAAAGRGAARRAKASGPQVGEATPSAQVLERMERLYAQRAPLYEQVAAVSVDASDGDPHEVTDRVVAALAGMSAPVRHVVGRDPGYEVVIGHGLDQQLVRAVLHSDARGAGGVAVVHEEALTEQAQRYAGALGAAGVGVTCVSVPGGEAGKRVEVLNTVWERLGECGVGRDGMVIGVGGGATTDLAGFAAATWLRGVPVIQVPTSLLAMVDAAVGGKTGIDTAAGKNLVGAFHEPTAVLSDLDTLRTLPGEELRAGLGEVVKCGFIADPVILDRVLADEGAGGLTTWDAPVLAELVTRSVAVKARVVGADLTEAGEREILNYGHTYAHAIETVTGYRWRHGEAVAVGCVFAAEVARALGLLDADAVALHRQAFAAAGLPVSFAAGAQRFEEVLAVMGRDKKVRGGRIRMVLLDAVGSPVRGVVPEREVLEHAHRQVCAPVARDGVGS